MTQEQIQNQSVNPVQLTVRRPEQSSRGLALATLLFMFPKMIFLLPHLIILYVLGIAAVITVFLAQFAVLFTGQYPVRLHYFIVGVARWYARVCAYAYGLVDEYPPFEL